MIPEGARSVLVQYDIQKLSPNQRIHWRERAKRAKTAKFCADAAWRTAGRPSFDGPIWYSLIVYRGRVVDQDNAVAACKSILDALFKGRVVPDDSERWAKLKSVEQMSSKAWNKCEAVSVIFWPRGDGE